ncbi:glycosyltransferase family 2 protein [Nitrospina sp. 32_T5]|uniref:glycosyltransferase family 2 protein n=1 Tax=unclassified Nitrospina TaxID=2638683 RepID=UPI003F97140D
MDLTFIIVTYNHGDCLDKCLQSIQDSVKDAHHEVLVVNNARQDRLDDFETRFPNVRVTTNRKNIGFARACNQAAREARGGLLVFLNPDARLHEGAVDALRNQLESDPGIGIVGPKVLNPDGTVQASCRRFPRLWTGLFHRRSLLSLWFPGNRFTREYLMLDFDHATTRDVDWVSGCCMMIARDRFRELGGFDERYFLFHEDVDLCRTAWQAGYRVVYHPEAVVTHDIGAGNRNLPALVIVRRHRGMAHYWKKHMRPNPVVYGLVSMAIGLRCLLQLMGTRWK